jgi:hypothetical protein
MYEGSLISLKNVAAILGLVLELGAVRAVG